MALALEEEEEGEVSSVAWPSKADGNLEPVKVYPWHSWMRPEKGKQSGMEIND